jgi:hypothetical protein
MPDVTIPFQPDLFDLGHVHLVWSTNLQAPVQDPAAVGTGNVYGTADVFTDASGANLYRVAIPSGQVIPAGQATPPSQQQQQPPGNQVTTTGRPSAAAFGPAGAPAGAQTGAAVAGTLGGVGNVLTQNTRIFGLLLPNFVWLGAVGAGAMALRRRRR